MKKIGKEKNFDNIWIDTEEKITPIVYSQSAMSKNLLENKIRCKVIFRNSFDSSSLLSKCTKAISATHIINLAKGPKNLAPTQCVTELTRI